MKNCDKKEKIETPRVISGCDLIADSNALCFDHFNFTYFPTISSRCYPSLNSKLKVSFFSFFIKKFLFLFFF